MILNIKPYCDTCPYFEPLVIRFHSDIGVFSQEIQCEHSKRCALIASHIKDCLEKGEKVNYDD